MTKPSSKTDSFPLRHVFVCVNSRCEPSERGCCAARGGQLIRDTLKKKLAGLKLLTQVRANNSGCLDKCENGVVVAVYPERVWYGGVQVGDLDEIIQSHIIGGKIVTRLLLPNQPWVEEQDLDPLPVSGK